MAESTPQSPVSAGEVIDGKYRVDRTLGMGGMGVVVAATQVDLERPVALKFLLPRFSDRTDVVARFAREARAAARLQSEHVARVLDVGTLPGGAPYIVMEFLEGEDLAEVCTKQGPLPVERAVGYVLEACEAVAEAHALGIVHRDLKPANLFLAKRRAGPPIVKVLDFGVSKLAEEDPQQASLTASAALVGSPLYMSPEQMMSARKVDPRSDIWSLGVVLYELLTGRPPFRGPRMPELVADILSNREEPVESLRTNLPPGLVAAVHRCLEKTPEMRFGNVAQLARAIAPYGSPQSDAATERISRILGVAVIGDEAPLTGMETARTDSDAPALPSKNVVAEKPWSRSVTGSTGAERGGASRKVLRFALPALFVAVGAGVWMTSYRTSTKVGSDPERTSAGPASATEAPMPSAAAGPRPLETLPPPSSPSEAPSATAAAAPPEIAAPPISAHRRVGASTVAAAPGPPVVPSATAPAPRPACSFQSYVDPSDGEVHFKKVCP